MLGSGQFPAAIWNAAKLNAETREKMLTSSQFAFQQIVPGKTSARRGENKHIKIIHAMEKPLKMTALLTDCK